MDWIITLIVGLIIGFLLGVWLCRSRRRPETETSSPDSSTVQETAGEAGRPGSWQDAASDNGIEDPTRLSPGAPLSRSEE